MIDGRNFLNQSAKNNLVRYDNIQKIATGHGDDYTTRCLLDYHYFNNHYNNIHLMLIQNQYSKSILLQI